MLGQLNLDSPMTALTLTKAENVSINLTLTADVYTDPNAESIGYLWTHKTKSSHFDENRVSATDETF
jgi:hypothetical protein